MVGVLRGCCRRSSSGPILGHDVHGRTRLRLRGWGGGRREARQRLLDTAILLSLHCKQMSVSAPLGEFEVVVLMAALHLSEGAYGSAIRDEIERRSGRAVSRGSVYITLDRLEEKGLLASRLGEANASRGGRPKRLFRVTTAGVKAVKHSVAILSRMHKGLEPVLGDL